MLETGRGSAENTFRIKIRVGMWERQLKAACMLHLANVDTASPENVADTLP